MTKKVLMIEMKRLNSGLIELVVKDEFGESELCLTKEELSKLRKRIEALDDETITEFSMEISFV